METASFSLVSTVERASLYFYEAKFSNLLTHYDPMDLIKIHLVSRLFAALLSPAGVVDLGLHSAAIPLTALYALGKSLYQRQFDFTIPWQHLQRVRNTISPILFGSILGFCHPYAGVATSESIEKHINKFILLSGTNHFVGGVSSPIRSLNFIASVGNSILTLEDKKLLSSAISWEKSLEKIQSIEFLDAKITYKTLTSLRNFIKESGLSHRKQIIAERVVMLAYPLLASMDLGYYVLGEALLLINAVILVAGGRSICYLETADSLELHIYTLGKMILYSLGATLGTLSGVFFPEFALSLSYISSKRYFLTKALLEVKLLMLRLQLYRLKTTEKLLLPVNIANPAGNSWLPVYNSHMIYMLIEKSLDGTYTAELIERGRYRGCYNGINKNLKSHEINNLCRSSLSLRYKSLEKSSVFLLENFRKENLKELGLQGNIPNCVVTNFFAALEVAWNKQGKTDDEFIQMCDNFKYKTLTSYSYLQDDFFPFSLKFDEKEEIEALRRHVI